MSHDLVPGQTRYLDYFQTLTEAAKSLTSSLHIDDVIDSIMRSVSQLLHPKNWSLLLIDEERRELYFELVVGEAADTLKHLRLPLGEGIAGWVVQHRAPTAVPSVRDDPRFSRRMDDASAFQTSSVACVPLIVRDRVLGVLELVKDAKDPEPYGERDLELLVPLADFMAIAIDNARNYKRVEELTILDEWTGLYNARFLHNYLPAELARAERYQQDFSLIFFDLDNFKDINDQHGHTTGSSVLREVGRYLLDATREPDRCIRYGGDEFVVVLPHTGKARALELAQRLCREIQARSFTGPTGAALRVTASFGVASFPKDASNHQGLLDAADGAMYLAKARRKNNVVDAANVA